MIHIPEEIKMIMARENWLNHVYGCRVCRQALGCFENDPEKMKLNCCGVGKLYYEASLLSEK